MSEQSPEDTKPVFPSGRVKKIMKLDPDIKLVNSEALFLVSLSTQYFLQHLAENSMKIAAEKKRKTVKLEHLRVAVQKHQPTRDFLLDSLPAPPQSIPIDPKRSSSANKKPTSLPPRTRRIDDFFRTSGNAQGLVAETEKE